MNKIDEAIQPPAGELKYCKEHRTIHCSCQQRIIDAQQEEIEKLKQANEGLLSGHFCPNPQLSKLASTCDCVHSDRHRKGDWEIIDKLTAENAKLCEKLELQAEGSDEVISENKVQAERIEKLEDFLRLEIDHIEAFIEVADEPERDNMQMTKLRLDQALKEKP